MTDCRTMAEAIRTTGFTRAKLKDILKKAGVPSEKCIPVDVFNDIVSEHETYISFRDFAAIPRGDRYDGSTFAKTKLLDELEANAYYGIDILDPEELLIGSSKDEVFFRRADIPKLETHLAQYLGLYALSEEDKVAQLLDNTDRTGTKACVQRYMESTMIEKAIKPSFTEFVSLVLVLPDLPIIEDGDIKQVLALQMSVTARNILLNFLNYARHHNPKVKYSQLKQQEQESVSIPAYRDETYLALAKCIFSPEYIEQHQMIEKALDNHFFIEMWLYLALHFCCGWRASDICRGWRYLRLSEKTNNPYGINTDTLYDDILNDRLPDNLYEDVCTYATKSVELSGQRPSKTAGVGTPPLAISITPELSTFFGLLTLISEAVMLRTNDGYMKPGRENTYQNKALYRKFFGQEMYDALHGENIHSRRLNKDYLQGIEESARQTGCGSLMASALASFARSHNNLDTIAHYLRDHTLNAENADMVLYFMLERGVFGFEIYQTLKTAYPDIMKKLPLRKQNELMAAVADNPYQIELEQSGIVASFRIKESFKDGDNETVLDMLKGMYEIAQGRGKGKDDGIHCICRARGNPCAHPEFDSCLANACPYLVFTRYGYKALLEVISDYKVAMDSGDVKKGAVLQQVIMPRFREILNTLMRDVNMSKNERAGMQFMLKEALTNGC